MNKPMVDAGGKKFLRKVDQLAVGSVVWAKVSGYPWWPATIAQNREKKVWKVSTGKVWVTFLNDNQGAWIAVKSHLLIFNKGSTTIVMDGIKSSHRSLPLIQEAIEEAKNALEKLGKQFEDEEEEAIEDSPKSDKKPEKTPKRSSTPRAQPKRSITTTDTDEAPKKKPKKAEIEKLDEEIVPAEETSKPQKPLSRSSRHSKRKILNFDGNKTDTSEDELDEVEKPKKAKEDSGKDKQMERIKKLEGQLDNLKSENKRLKEQLKTRAPMRRDESLAVVPSSLPDLEFPIPENLSTLAVTKDKLLDELKTLKQLGHLFEEHHEDMVDHRKTACEMASKFNARVRALTNKENTMRKIEKDLAAALSKLLRWAIPVELLKESHAGKPLRKVESRCGKHSPTLAALCKALVNQWMALVNREKHGENPKLEKSSEPNVEHQSNGGSEVTKEESSSVPEPMELEKKLHAVEEKSANGSHPVGAGSEGKREGDKPSEQLKPSEKVEEPKAEGVAVSAKS